MVDDAVTRSIAEAVFLAASVAVIVYWPVVEGDFILSVNVPLTSVVLVPRVVVPILTVTSEFGVNRTPFTRTFLSVPTVVGFSINLGFVATVVLAVNADVDTGVETNTDIM